MGLVPAKWLSNGKLWSVNTGKPTDSTHKSQPLRFMVDPVPPRELNNWMREYFKLVNELLQDQ